MPKLDLGHKRQKWLGRLLGCFSVKKHLESDSSTASDSSCSTWELAGAIKSRKYRFQSEAETEHNSRNKLKNVPLETDTSTPILGELEWALLKEGLLEYRDPTASAPVLTICKGFSNEELRFQSSKNPVYNDKSSSWDREMLDGCDKWFAGDGRLASEPLIDGLPASVWLECVEPTLSILISLNSLRHRRSNLSVKKGPPENLDSNRSRHGDYEFGPIAIFQHPGRIQQMMLLRFEFLNMVGNNVEAVDSNQLREQNGRQNFNRHRRFRTTPSGSSINENFNDLTGNLSDLVSNSDVTATDSQRTTTSSSAESQRTATSSYAESRRATTSCSAESQRTTTSCSAESQRTTTSISTECWRMAGCSSAESQRGTNNVPLEISNIIDYNCSNNNSSCMKMTTDIMLAANSRSSCWPCPDSVFTSTTEKRPKCGHLSRPRSIWPLVNTLEMATEIHCHSEVLLGTSDECSEDATHWPQEGRDTYESNVTEYSINGETEYSVSGKDEYSMNTFTRYTVNGEDEEKEGSEIVAWVLETPRGLNFNSNASSGEDVIEADNAMDLESPLASGTAISANAGQSGASANPLPTVEGEARLNHPAVNGVVDILAFGDHAFWSIIPPAPSLPVPSPSIQADTGQPSSWNTPVQMGTRRRVWNYSRELVRSARGTWSRWKNRLERSITSRNKHRERSRF